MFDKWSDKATWDAVSTYAVLCDKFSHAFVDMESLALIVFNEG
jgi:hypothetical protein